MCGIVAGVAGRDVVPVFLQGLKRLEYRGYDSCGVAVVRDGEIDRARSVARVKDLAEQVRAEGMHGTVGIAHTRWATHGGPVVANAHPHIAGNRIALVHNGIIENFAQLRAELEATGVTMQSQTDTEVLAHLVNFYLEDDLLEALKKAEGIEATEADIDAELQMVADAQNKPLDEIKEKLSASKYIKQFYYAPANEGGDGATIAVLK